MSDTYEIENDGANYSSHGAIAELVVKNSKIASLEKEIQSLKALVVEARPVVFSVNKRVDLRPGTYRQLEDWLEKTKDIKVDA